MILSWLAQRDYSQHEIKQKLLAKGYVTTAVQWVVADLVQTGIINDQRVIEHYIDRRYMKGYGPIRIQNELRARGIAANLIAEQLKIADNDWLMQARHVWQKHFKNKLPQDFKTRSKQIRFLQYRGFTQEQIAPILQGENETT